MIQSRVVYSCFNPTTSTLLVAYGTMELVARLTGYIKATGALVMMSIPLLCWRGQRLQGELFHVYLIVWGLFRFAHEYFRDPPRLVGGIPGYQFLAMGIFLLGVVRWVRCPRGLASIFV